MQTKLATSLSFAASLLLLTWFWSQPGWHLGPDQLRSLAVTPPAGSTAAAMYLVLLDDPPLAYGLDGRRPAGKFDMASQANIAYREMLLRRQAIQVQAMEKQIGRPLQISQRYSVVANGFAAEMTAAEAMLLADMPRVRLVSPDRARQPLTDAGPEWIGAAGVWSGSSTGGILGTRGENIIIGVIDTGINLDHPAFAEIGHDGFVHPNPYGSGNYVGLCESEPVTYQCNAKLIGVWSWPASGNNPEDDWGHGSNVASIAAGNVLNLTYTAPTMVLTPTLSGVAPHANLIAYDVCDAPGGNGCPDSLSIAAVEQAVEDGVDVINFSIGGETVDPWQDPLALAFLAARQAGIVVVTSAGNGGPSSGSINSPANAPWITSVGNSTHHARFVNRLQQLSGGDTVPPPEMVGSSVTGAYGPAALVYAAGACEKAFSSNTWVQGEIVLCDYSANVTTLDQAKHVLAGGGAGVILAANHDFPQLLRIDRLPIPGMQLRQSDADLLRLWLSSGSGHQGMIRGTARLFDSSYGDELFLTSARGPAPLAGNALKPNLVAPGSRIWGAFRADADPNGPPELAFYTGTSQAGPHVAGGAALLRALHGDWTAAEIESALMMTAQSQTVRLADGLSPATPLDAGAGRIALDQAARAGLVLPLTVADFEAADPALGDGLGQLNLAGLVNDDCPVHCSWNRQLRSTLAVTATWQITTSSPLSLDLSVSPERFTLAPGETQVITITADMTQVPAGGWDWAEVRLGEMDSKAPDAHLSLLVRRSAVFLPLVLKP